MNRAVQAARIVHAAQRAWEGRQPPAARRPAGPEPAVRGPDGRAPAGRAPAAAVTPRAGVTSAVAPSSAAATTAVAPSASGATPAVAPPARRGTVDAVGRVGRVAARVAWVAATLGLVALGLVELVTAVRTAGALPAHGGGWVSVLGTGVAILLLALAGVVCLLCAPSCAPRVIGRRRAAGRSRLPRVLFGAETTARIAAAAYLVGAALEAHESAHLWFTRGPGTGPLLARVAVHPGSLIVAGLAAAALSLRWSRLLHARRRRGAVSR